MAKATAKEVAASSQNLPQERPSWMNNDAGRGNEGVSAEDMVIPRLAIIQDLSPQWKEGKDEYIEGAKVKSIFNTATQQLYGESMVVVPVLFRKEWVIWKDIDSGGGFRGAFPDAATAAAELQKLDDAGQCEVVDTGQHFVLVLDPETMLPVEQAVISMSKSQMKISRKWNTTIQTFGGDRFERAYTLEVADDKNAAGQEYYNWKVTPIGFVNEETFKAAEKLYEDVKKGALDVKRDQDAGAAHNQGSTDADSEF